MILRKLAALALGIALTATLAVRADDKKDEKPEAKKVSLEGMLVCTKCELKETKTCGHALLVKDKTDKKDKSKEVKYYLDDKGAKESYHGACCTQPIMAKVTGKLVEKKEMKDGKEVTKKVIEEPKVGLYK